jgi:uncharacterized membrane protein YphA (DoxX/SURF4 family)
MVFNVFLLLGLVFSPLASLMTFLITFAEYTHHYSDSRKPLQIAIQAAIVTFAFFFALSLLIGFVWIKWIGT